MSTIVMVNDAPEEFNACMKVIGVGGGGCNAVEHMIDKGAQGVTFIAANTDQQALNHSRADVVIPLGKTGLGAGAKPEVGAQAAEDAAEKIREALEGAHLLFITAGMGGGTGTGAAPVIARIAKEMGILTIAIVTKPFDFEGARRMSQAQAGIEKLKESIDSLIVIMNDKLEDEVGEDATMLECFAAADDVLYKACNGIAEIIRTRGLINVDFEDLRTIMGERGTAMMGTATASGPDRAREAAEKAITCPLLEGANLQGARGLLVFVSASSATFRQSEVRKVMAIMKNFVSKDAQEIVGTAFDESLGDDLQVTVVATGLDELTGEPIQKPLQPEPTHPTNPIGIRVPTGLGGLNAPMMTGDQLFQRNAASTQHVEQVAPIATSELFTKPSAPQHPTTIPTMNMAGQAPIQTVETQSAVMPQTQETDDAWKTPGADFIAVPTFLRNK